MAATQGRLRRSLFWDVSPASIDLKRHARYIIERVLEHGNDDELRWLFRQYPRRAIRRVVEHPRGLTSAKAKGLWSIVVR